MLCAKFDWNWPSGSWEEDENVTSLQTDRHTDGRTEDGQKVIRKAHNKATITKEIGMEMKEFYEKCLGMYLTPPLCDVIPFKIIMTMIIKFWKHFP